MQWPANTLLAGLFYFSACAEFCKNVHSSDVEMEYFNAGEGSTFPPLICAVLPHSAL